MQWDVVSGTLTMSVVLLSSDDNAITKRRGKKIKARQGTGSAPTRTLLAPCEGYRSVLLQLLHKHEDVHASDTQHITGKPINKK